MTAATPTFRAPKNRTSEGNDTAGRLTRSASGSMHPIKSACNLASATGPGRNIDPNGRGRASRANTKGMVMYRQRVFLLSVTLAAAAATPAWGQVAAPAIGPADSGTQSAASIPDFSGIWGNSYLYGIEPPLSGPGPVVNKSRVRQRF